MQIGKQLSRIYLIYYVILTAIFVASFFPDSRVWGYNMWAFIPNALKYFFLAIGLVTPIVANFMFRENEVDIDESQDNRKLFLISGAIFVGYLLLFYYFRSTTHFLGDGYNLLGVVESENPIIKERNLLAILLNRALYSLVPESLENRNLIAFQFISIFSGMLYFAFGVLLAKKTCSNLTDRVLLLLSILSCGQMLLFFGYVENYSLFNVILFAFIVASILNLNSKLKILYPTLIGLVAPFFHIFGIILLPPLALLWMLSNTQRPASNIIQNKTFKISLLSLTIIGVVGFIYAYNNFMFFQFAIVPFAGNNFVLEDYTMFSIKHILDVTNQLLILIPALPLLLYSFITKIDKKSIAENSILFLILLSVEALVILFIFDPKLGMPRDWDLFALVGIPLSTLLFLFLVESRDKIKHYRQVLILSIILGWLILTPRIYTNVVPQAALDQVQSYFNLDVKKSMQSVNIVQHYAVDSNYQTTSSELLEFYNTRFPEKELITSAKKFISEGLYYKAIKDLLEAKKINPTMHVTYTELATCYLFLNNFEEARKVSEISNGLNPYNAQTLENLGVAYYNLGRLDDAIGPLLNSFELRNERYMVISTIRTIYDRQLDKQNHDKFIDKINALIFDDDSYKLDYIDFLIKENNINKLISILQEFSPNEISELDITKLIDKYPELEEHLKN